VNAQLPIASTVTVPRSPESKTIVIVAPGSPVPRTSGRASITIAPLIGLVMDTVVDASTVKVTDTVTTPLGPIAEALTITVAPSINGIAAGTV
jgi:hypothetical protein